jgi:hypothetical protein
MARTQLFETFLATHDFWDPNGLLPPGNPSIEVGGLCPPPQFVGFPERRGRLDLEKSGLEKKYQRVGSLPKHP